MLSITWENGNKVKTKLCEMEGTFYEVESRRSGNDWLTDKLVITKSEKDMRNTSQTNILPTLASDGLQKLATAGVKKK